MTILVNRAARVPFLGRPSLVSMGRPDARTGWPRNGRRRRGRGKGRGRNWMPVLVPRAILVPSPGAPGPSGPGAPGPPACTRRGRKGKQGKKGKEREGKELDASPGAQGRLGFSPGRPVPAPQGRPGATGPSRCQSWGTQFWRPRTGCPRKGRKEGKEGKGRNGRKETRGRNGRKGGE